MRVSFIKIERYGKIASCGETAQCREKLGFLQFERVETTCEFEKVEMRD